MVNKERARFEVDRIRDILNREWNPIPGTPDDEYDTYAYRIVSMLINEKAGAESVSAYLLSVERDMLGYQGNALECIRVAGIICAKG